MKYLSVINYYQTVICYHNIKGKVVVNWSDPMLAQTVKGIKNLETVPEDVKDPLTEDNLKAILKNVILKNEFSFPVQSTV